MLDQGKEIEILSRKSVFGKQIAEVKILSTGEVVSVPFSELSDEKKAPTDADIAFKAIAAKIKNEVFKQSMLAPIESNIVPLPHQILALEKVMAGQFLRFLIADEVGMGKTIETGLILKELKLRGIAKRTLIVVPKSAMGQWQRNEKAFQRAVSITNGIHQHGHRTLQIKWTTKSTSLRITIRSFFMILKPIETRQGGVNQKWRNTTAIAFKVCWKQSLIYW